MKARPRSTAAALFVVAVFTTTNASAAGFAVGEQGASSLGVAGAATARDDLPETGYYNPAATPAGPVGTVGVSLIFPNIEHVDPDSGETTSAEGGAETPPYVHLGWIADFGRHRAGLIAVGHVPFGAGLHWPGDWTGRFDVTAIELQVFEVSANAVYGLDLTDDLSLGVSASLRALRSTVELSRQIDAVESEASVRLGGVANAFSGGAAAHARWRDLCVGLNFRAAATMDFTGAAHFEDVPPELSGAAHDQAVSTSVTLPRRLAVGGAYDLGFGTPSVEAEWFGWSSFQTFGIDFADEETPDVEEPRNWHDTVTLRAGYEHRLPMLPLSLRGGVAFDPTPSPTDTLSPTLPDASRIVGTIGAGYHFDFGLRIDAAFAHIALLGAEATGEDAFPAIYGGSAEVLSFGVAYQSPRSDESGVESE